MYVIRLKTILRALAITALVSCILLFGAVTFRRKQAPKPVLAVVHPDEFLLFLDAGHGGMDGGAVSKNGVAEADINLAITLKTRAFLRFVGVSAELTRTDAQSLNFNSDATARENKNADLYARLALAKARPELDFLSIHLNKFEQEKYYGAQVFYSPNTERSKTLAQCLQDHLRSALDQNNDRRIKLSPDGVMLMKNINAPAVTIECGFLSNDREEALLQQDSYQTKIALAIACGYIQYLETK